MRNELYDAAAFIKKSCEEQKLCLECPFCLSGDICCFEQEKVPAAWDLSVVRGSVELSNAPDNVNHPEHYTQGGIECIDALAAATINLQGLEAVCTANAIKYLWRWKGKNGVEDLKKAKWYIDRLIREAENDC